MGLLGLATCDINYLVGLYQQMNNIYLKFKTTYDLFSPDIFAQMMKPSQWDTPGTKGKSSRNQSMRFSSPTECKPTLPPLYSS